MLGDVVLHFGQCVTDGIVRAEQVVMLVSVPFHETGELLADGLEKSDNDADRCAFHVIAKLVDSRLVGGTVVSVELHLFPHGKEDGRQHEDCWPVLELLATVDG